MALPKPTPDTSAEYVPPATDLEKNLCEIFGEVLGIHMLRELVENTPDDTVIWCLLRPKGTLSAERRLKEKLVYYFAKDYQPLFGRRASELWGLYY